MPVLRRYVLPFAAGVAVGVAAHKYWPKIEPRARKALSAGRRLLAGWLADEPVVEATRERAALVQDATARER